MQSIIIRKFSSSKQVTIMYFYILKKSNLRVCDCLQSFSTLFSSILVAASDTKRDSFQIESLRFSQIPVTHFIFIYSTRWRIPSERKLVENGQLSCIFLKSQICVHALVCSVPQVFLFLLSQLLLLRNKGIPFQIEPIRFSQITVTVTRFITIYSAC